MDIDLSMKTEHTNILNKKMTTTSKLVKYIYINKKYKNNTQTFKWNTYKRKQIRLINAKINKITEKVINNFNDIITYKKKQVLTLLLIALRINKYKSNEDQVKKNYIIAKQLAYSSINNIHRNDLNKKQAKINAKEKKHDNIIKLFQTYIFITQMQIQLVNSKCYTAPISSKNTIYTVLKSPHADKKAREQFIKKTYSITTKIKHFSSIINIVELIVRKTMHEFISSYKYKNTKFF